MKPSTMKQILFSFGLLLCFGVSLIRAQCDCSNPIVPPTVANGISITNPVSSGSVSSWATAYSSCGVTTPPNSLYLGQNGSFSYTLNFSSPIQGICAVITATGDDFDENFIFTTNTGIPSITAQTSCYTTINGNEIISGSLAPNNSQGGGGVFQITSQTYFTSLTITGDGGSLGSLFAFCLNSIIPPEPILLGDLEICQNDTPPVIPFIGNGGVAPYTFNYSINGGATQTVTSVGDTAFVTAPTTVVDTFFYTIESVTDSFGISWQQTDTFALIVNPLPEASVIGDTTICLNDPAPQIAFVGSNSSPPYTFTYSLNGGSPQTVTSVGDSAFISVPTSASGSFSYALISIADSANTNCSQLQTDTALVNVSPIPVADFTAINQEGCLTICAELTSTSTVDAPSTIVDYEWFMSNGTTQNGGNTTFTECLTNETSNTQFYDVALTVTTAQGCQNTYLETDYVSVFPQPSASFFFDPDEPSTLDSEVDFVNTSDNAENYSWNFDGLGVSSSINPTFEFPEEAETYSVQLIAFTNEGCADTTRMDVEIFEDVIFYVPNTFTPDGNSYNEVFQPMFYSGFDPQDYKLLIYNRWGEVLFESNDASMGWDGTYGGKRVKEGTYIWKIEFKEKLTDERQNHTGHVNVLR